MSEAKQVPGQALLELFDEAAKSYAHIVSLASLAPSWDGQRTIEELAPRCPEGWRGRRRRAKRCGEYH